MIPFEEMKKLKEINDLYNKETCIRKKSTITLMKKNILSLYLDKEIIKYCYDDIEINYETGEITW
jgi:hypothetical protein